MKRMQSFFILLAVICVFFLSFFIGRASALRNNSANEVKLYTGTVPLPREKKEVTDTPASTSPKVKVEKDVNNDIEKKSEKATKMIFPCGEVVLNKYSEMAVYSKTMEDWRAHTGIDYATKSGDDVKATADGTVLSAGKNKFWGYTIEIDHGDGIITKYKNLSKDLKVKKGDKIIMGDIIGQVGKTASVENKESAHLHFEIWQDGMVINPESYVYKTK